MHKLIVGLTGGIGSGKSTVAKLFAELGIEIIDTDQIARDVIQSDSAVLQKIINHFGTDILNAEGSLVREKLRDIVFADPHKRKWLEKLLHPLIREEAKHRAQRATSPYCIIVIPLLIENLPHTLVNRILVVDTAEAIQIKRVKQRNHLTEKQIHNILNAQATREERLQATNDIIYNDKDIEYLEIQVKKLHAYYLQLSSHGP